MLWLQLAVRRSFDWPWLNYNMNLVGSERHEPQERWEDDNVRIDNLCNTCLTTVDVTFRIIHAFTCQLLADLLGGYLLHHMPC